MSLSLCVRAPAASVGQHNLVLRDIAEVDGQWGRPAYRWIFAVVGGDEDGHEVAKTTGQDLRRGNALGELANALFGRELAVGEEVDLAELIGRVFDASVIPGPDGNGAVLDKIQPAGNVAA